MRDFGSYIVTIIVCIIAGGFIGCGIGFAFFHAPSTGTGYGSLVGGLFGIGYCFTNRNKQA